MLQNKANSISDRTTLHDETLGRMAEELKGKIDGEEFRDQIRSAHAATESFTDVSMTVQLLQKELMKQRVDSDAMMDRTTQMVRLQLEQFNTQMRMDGDELGGSPYVTKAELKSFLKSGKFSKFDADSPPAEGGKPEDSSENSIDDFIKPLRDSDGYYSDEIDMESEFEFELNDTNEHEFRTAAISVDGEVEFGEVYTSLISSTGQRRNIGLGCSLLDEEEDGGGKKRHKKGGPASQGRVPTPAGSAPDQPYLETIDEGKLTSKIMLKITGKLETMLSEMITSIGLSGVKLEAGEARVLMNQLSVVQSLQEEMEKLKLLVGSKHGKVEAERELSLRITREEFFRMMITIFPGNPSIQRAMTAFRKKLPPLEDVDGSLTGQARPRTSDSFEKHGTTAQRRVQTAGPQKYVPARSSKLLALNQRFLRGADGRYYLRDIGLDLMQPTGSVVGSSGQPPSAPEEAFDFQPFVPMPYGGNENMSPETIRVPSQHRARTPPDPTD
jgi:hypothetical protein